MEFIDLTYHFALPQNAFSCPKYLISEITKEIEYAACTEFYESLFDYSYYKMCQKLNLQSRKVEWATDLNNSNKYLTVTNFNINDEFIKIGDLKKYPVFTNELEIEFHLLFIELLGGSIYEEEIFGVVEDNTFYKMFNATSFFEFEATVYFSSSAKDVSKDFFSRDVISILNEIDKELLLNLKPYFNEFCKLSIRDLYELFDYPDTPKFDKGKKWIVEKYFEVQSELNKFFD